MNGGIILGMTGQTVTKNGDTFPIPTLFDTFILCLKLIFFSEKALYKLILDFRLTYNLITIFLLMLLIPYRNLDGRFGYDLNSLSSGIVVTIFYIFFLYLLKPNNSLPFRSFLRVFIAFEAISIFSPITFILSKHFLLYFNITMVCWYLLLSIYFFVKIYRVSIIKSSLIVLLSYFIAIFLFGIFIAENVNFN